MKVLALDLSKKNTGWALFEDGTLATIGEVSFSDCKTDKEFLTKFKEWFEYRSTGVQAVVYEAAKPRNMNHSAIHFGMIAVMRLTMPEHSVHSVIWSTAKKVLTGKGNATKDDMLAQAKKDYPTMPIMSHDQADAIAVGLAHFVLQNTETPF